MRLSRLCPHRIYRRRGGRVKPASSRIAALCGEQDGNSGEDYLTTSLGRRRASSPNGIARGVCGIKLSGAHPGLRQLIA